MKINLKHLLICLLFSLANPFAQAQNTSIDKLKIQEDLNALLQNISQEYVYLSDKKVDINCLREKYTSKIETLNNQADVILFFEYLLNELYDSHISLNTNLNESYRLTAPMYVGNENGKFFIKNVWQTQISNLETNILGAEVIKFNGLNFNQCINDFPSLCADKTALEVRNWLANKIIAGKYNEPRVLTLILKNGKTIDFDVDGLKFKQHSKMLNTQLIDDIAIIRINDALGENKLISIFDSTLKELSQTKGIILDLRNTSSGGNTYVAKGIMSRFIDEELPYQKHSYIEKYDGQTEVVRSWIEFVTPRGEQYKKPLIVLVGRWTGSMGEGMAVGFDGMRRAQIVGSEMKRLAGSVFDFGFDHLRFGYKLTLQRLYHTDGTARESYIPSNYVNQSSIQEDETLKKGLELIQSKIE